MFQKYTGETLKENYDLKKVIETCKKDVKSRNRQKSKKNTKNRRKRRKETKHRKTFRKKQYFPLRKERISTDKISEICKEEQIYMK